MATKIVLSELAPADAKFFSLANDEIEVPFETNDTEIISNAVAHPWLDVEREESVDDFDAGSRTTFPADDPDLSKANDPEAVAAEREAREVEFAHATAIDAGLDQGDVEFVGDEDHEVAVTLAADDSRDDAAADEPQPKVEPTPEPAGPAEDDPMFVKDTNDEDGGF